MGDDNIIPTKWQWAAEACTILNMPEAAKIARKIDECLEKTYPNKSSITEEWKSACLGHQLYYGDHANHVEIMEVATNSLYCTACDYTEAGNCNGCQFAINGGTILHEIFKHYLYNKQ